MKTVRTAAQILTMFDGDTPTITVTGAANRFGLTASASSRLLAALATSGIIQREPDRSYRPGPLAYRLGLLYHAHNRLSDRINDGARTVVDQTGRTCWVSVLTETNNMLISRFPGRRDQGFHVNPGNLLPANASAAGKALLARMSDAELRKLLTGKKLDAWTEKSKTDIEAVLSDVAFIREHGWSIIIDELFVDTVSVGVAFAAPMEATPMALSMSLHSASPEEIASGVKILTEVACEIGAMIGDPFWSARRPSADLATILAEVEAYMAIPVTS
ncbi:IclR family transcriptional regulator [Bosea minatitlanensis]|uniref:IclR family transcriptional regulator n=1 Tax=Bosea minatitlanensis TaxID=128782 RepID=A0ABW0F1T9_9HYPH|nr:IclR family transcriptional regulator C-terminal domain-containing protein [Bosea minatitlanensis]MCT4492549.1 helix-turn-helix domain-containing protein [Bosea minatitlanensis]